MTAFQTRSRVQARFLCPHQDDQEIVVLTDEPAVSAVFASNRGLHALSAGATRIVRSSFMDERPRKLPSLLEEYSDDETSFAAQWIDEAVKDGMFRLLAARPKLGECKTISVSAGQGIPLKHFKGKRQITVEHDGALEERKVGNTIVHWYTSRVPVTEKVAMLGSRYAASTSSQYPASATMQIRRLPGGVGVRCGVCAACGSCGGCGACALCGGVNFAVAAAALVAVDASLLVANAASTFEMLRGDAL